MKCETNQLLETVQGSRNLFFKFSQIQEANTTNVNI